MIVFVLIIPHLASREKWVKLRPKARRPTHIKQETEFKFDDEGADDNGSETEGSLFEWEEEATLLSDLMEEEPPQTADQRYDALVESLQDPFLNESKRLKKEIAGTLVPAANRVKVAYQRLDQHVDTAYGQGIVQFNKACTEIEETMSTEQTKFRKAYQSTQAKIDILFERLKKEYAVRDQLWVDVKKAIDEIGIFLECHLTTNAMRN
ncbi:hypothetical protein BYT27DRAFT_7188164 [Phlegmacium glaucopus]|nr:hypothetical protein BYT27DRAFT_7188164 [Phlegmacium glaucopus]